MNTGMIVVYVISFVSLLCSAYLHGREKTGKHNFLVDIVNILLNITLFVWVNNWNFI